jgi:hypothetical protein
VGLSLLGQDFEVSVKRYTLLNVRKLCSAKRSDRSRLNKHDNSRKDFPANGSAPARGGII